MFSGKSQRVEVDPFEPDQFRRHHSFGLVGCCAGGKLMGITRAGPRKARDEDVVLGYRNLELGKGNKL